VKIKDIETKGVTEILNLVWFQVAWPVVGTCQPTGTCIFQVAWPVVGTCQPTGTCIFQSIDVNYCKECNFEEQTWIEH
jgi:hypothetical protein